MKCKKIRNVDKSVCTCEQKVAYNFAFSWRDQLKKANDVERSEIIELVKKQCMNNEKINQYNVDAIVLALKNGVKEYLAGCSILTSYSDIGKTFPLYTN